MTSVGVFPHGTAAAAGAGGPTVSALANGDYNSSASSPVYVGIRFHTNGAEYEYTAAGGVGSAVNTWLTSGSSSEVWVAYTLNSGTSFVGKSAGTRYQLNAIQNFYFTATTILDFRTNNSYFTFYDAASGGNTLDTTSSATWTAEYTGGGGPCPLCCFTPDTLITMADGKQMAIGNIMEGDLIRVENGIEPVTEVLTRERRAMYEVRFSDDRILRMSDDHPIYVEGKGYAAINPVIEYKDLGMAKVLEIGDPVVTINSALVKVESIEQIEYPDTVYTFENSRFFANGVLVY